MQSGAKLFGHPIHQMLVPIPIGLLVAGVVLDIVHRVGGAPWIPLLSFWNIALGVAGALLAAVFGLIDWVGIQKGTRAKRVGILHGSGNVLLVLLFGLALFLRLRTPGHVASGVAFAVELIALTLGAVTAWLGGELVDRFGVGVARGANLDAPSPFQQKQARMS